LLPVRSGLQRDPRTMPRNELLPLYAVAALAAVVSVAGVIGHPRSPEGDRYIAADHPAAVLAWAKTRCYANLALRHGAPRAHAEDVLAVAAAYETVSRHGDIAALCRQALERAAPVLDKASAPERSGEAALYASAIGILAAR
jgi:hypothetical protein